MSHNDSSALTGRTVAGKFVVDALIGEGGTGAVYRARHLALDRVVALKVLRDDLAHDGQFTERFKREARAASRLDHPNSVRVLDFGQDGELLYLAMEYVEGQTLFQVIRAEWPLEDQRQPGLRLKASGELWAFSNDPPRHQEVELSFHLALVATF
jgi:eukaryotic-like serine/threonine-protein kinase